MITLVIGGARSGKSDFAETLARRAWEAGRPVTYIATAEVVPGDAEMEQRIALHRERRPKEWRTWEASPAELPSLVASEDSVMLMDCLTMYLSRAFFAEPASEEGTEAEWKEAEGRILSGVRALLAACPERSELILVTNELGWGIVPENRMSRRFRDMQGRANRAAAEAAARAAMVVAGIPIWIKGSPDE